MTHEFIFNNLFKHLKSKKPYLIQVLLGPRQVGKTTLAEKIYQKWDGPKTMVTADSPSPPKPEWIEQHWQQTRMKGEGALLILDEIQKITGWSEQVKILCDEEKKKPLLSVLILGSSSLYLQKGLDESLAGRFELTEYPHWTYESYRQVFGWDFEKYLRFGAYPGTVELADDPVRWKNYVLNSIIEPVLGKDILGQASVAKPALFRQTFELAIHYPAQMVSFQKMLGQLQDRGNAATIKHYLTLLEKSFLLKNLEKYSGSPLRMKESSPKIVVLNPALIHAYCPHPLLEYDPGWYGRVFESIMGAHLLRLADAKFYYWREGQDEVDYVIKTADQKIIALEIKSGVKKRYGAGLNRFYAKHPKSHCLTWGYQECVEFMEGKRKLF